MTLSQRLLEEQEVTYEAEENQYTEEIDRLESLPSLFADGSWSMEDMEWIVRWKSSRSIGYFERNDREDVTQHVNDALAADSVSEKVDVLTELDGVQVRMASAILLFVSPDRFTVLDWRAWNVLHENGYLPDEMPDDPTIEDYLLYLGACWAIANEYDVSLRTLDMALWALGGDE
jgi:thermostable 8-oxoguanine DNA glycosylase